MTDLNIGDSSPNFTLPADGGSDISLSDYKGRFLVLYFYPKDDTPGCTTEAIGFTEKIDAFAKLGADILGVSKDTPAKHDKFITKHGLKVRLASDEDGAMIESYGAWVEKNMYGRKYMGIERATFLIGPNGKILQIWRKVRVKGHVESVLKALDEHVNAA